MLLNREVVIFSLVKDVEAVSKKARQDDDLGTEHLQVREAVLLVVFWKLIDEM